MADGRVGVWVDHEKAFLVRLGARTPGVERIDSGVEGHVRVPGGVSINPSYTQVSGAPGDKADRRRNEHLRGYYRRLAGLLDCAERVFVLGPGMAPDELAAEIRRHHPVLAKKLDETETCALLTEPQLVARVREHFGEPTRRS